MSKRSGCSTIFLSLALFFSLAAVCSAYDLGEYADGCLVPYASYDNGTTDTVVGLRVQGWAQTIYWSFLSAEGAQLGNGAIPTAGSWLHSFSLKGADGAANPDIQGYLVFTYDDNGTLDPGEGYKNLTANALLLSIDDAAYIPVIPLDRADYDPAAVDLTALGPFSIIGLSHGFSGGKQVSMRYFTDPSLGGSTWLIVWESGGNLGSLDPAALRFGNYPPVFPTIERAHGRLNVFNVSTDVTGMPTDYVDGEIMIRLGDGGGFAFSFISSSAFSALQSFTAHEE